MKKKIIALGLCVVLAMTTVTGCGKKSSKSSEKEETVSMAATDLAGKSVKFTVKLNYINKMYDQFVKDNEGYLTYFMYQYFSVATSYSDLKSVEEDMKRGLRTTNVISDVFSKLQSETKVEENQDAINKYIADHPEREIQYVIGENEGYAKSFIDALNMCGDSDYYAFADQDDIWSENHIESLLANIGEKAICVGEAELIDSNGNKMGLTFNQLKGNNCIPDEDIPKAQYIFRCIPIKESTFEEDSVLRKVLSEILKDIEENDSQILYSSPNDWIPYIPRDGEVETADDKFDYESLVLMREIEERIKKLREKGIKQYVIERLVRNNKRLSKLTITKNNKIFLHEYFIEINMTPLPKALYFLFLNHPEGIMFSYLPDFREELLEIYKRIKGPLYKESEARKSIWDLTDPLGNSINEKCSRIREAFVSQFDEHLACNYCITGIRGEAKKIILPRDLVIWEE